MNKSSLSRGALALVAAPSAASADGLGGLSAMPALLLIIAGIYAASVAAVIFLILVTRRWAAGAAGRGQPAWLSHPGIPVPLRVLVLILFCAAVWYGGVLLFGLVLGPGLEPGWRLHRALILVLTVLLSVRVGLGIIDRSALWGYWTGLAFAGLLVFDSLAWLAIHGREYFASELLLFGLVCGALILHGRHYWSPGVQVE